MGGHNEFGKLPIHIRRIVYYSLSPYEQNAWVYSVSRGIPNLAKRFFSALPTIIPGFAMTVGTYQWANWAHACSLRKDPRDFENDE